jgi:hypothetical protein
MFITPLTMRNIRFFDEIVKRIDDQAVVDSLVVVMLRKGQTWLNQDEKVVSIAKDTLLPLKKKNVNLEGDSEKKNDSIIIKSNHDLR